MIIKNFSDIPYGTCKVACIRPDGKGEFSGSLNVADKSYSVSIARDESRGEQDRVWARVALVNDVSSGVIDSYATAVAEKAIENDEWGSVKVDLHDGETAYMRTWTYDFPDDQGMDDFLAEAARFIETHIGELLELDPSSLPGIDLSDDEDFDFSVF